MSDRTCGRNDCTHGGPPYECDCMPVARPAPPPVSPPLPEYVEEAIRDLARAAFLHGQQGGVVTRWEKAEIDAGADLRAAIARHAKETTR